MPVPPPVTAPSPPVAKEAEPETIVKEAPPQRKPRNMGRLEKDLGRQILTLNRSTPQVSSPGEIENEIRYSGKHSVGDVSGVICEVAHNLKAGAFYRPASSFPRKTLTQTLFIFSQLPKCFDEAEQIATQSFDRILCAVKVKRENILTEIRTLRRSAENLLHNRKVEADDLKRRISEVS